MPRAKFRLNFGGRTFMERRRLWPPSSFNSLLLPACSRLFESPTPSCCTPFVEVHHPWMSGPFHRVIWPVSSRAGPPACKNFHGWGAKKKNSSWLGRHQMHQEGKKKGGISEAKATTNPRFSGSEVFLFPLYSMHFSPDSRSVWPFSLPALSLLRFLEIANPFQPCASPRLLVISNPALLRPPLPLGLCGMPWALSLYPLSLLCALSHRRILALGLTERYRFSWVGD